MSIFQDKNLTNRTGDDFFTEKRRANSAIGRPIKVSRFHERALIHRRKKQKRGKKKHNRRRRKNRKRRRNYSKKHKNENKKKIKINKKKKSKAIVAKKVFTSFRAEHTTGKCIENYLEYKKKQRIQFHDIIIVYMLAKSKIKTL